MNIIEMSMLVLTALAGLSVKFTSTSRSNISMEYELKGEMFMNLLLTVTSCLAGNNAGVCGGCNSGECSNQSFLLYMELYTVGFDSSHPRQFFSENILS